MGDIAKLVEEYVKAAESGGEDYNPDYDAALRRLRGALFALLLSRYLPDANVSSGDHTLDVEIGADTVNIEIQHSGEFWIEGEKAYCADVIGGAVSHDRLIEAVDEMFALLQSIPDSFEWAL